MEHATGPTQGHGRTQSGMGRLLSPEVVRNVCLSRCQTPLEHIPTSHSYDTPQRAPTLLDNGEKNDLGTIQLPDDYTTTLADSCPKYLPDLLPDTVLELNRYTPSYGTYSDEGRSSRQSTLATWCLVSRQWNRILTPILYAEIFIGGKEPLLTQSLLHRTLRCTNKSFVKTITIEPAGDGLTVGLLSVCFSMPNLRKVILGFERIYPAALHPNFAQTLRSLSKFCTIQMRRSYDNTINIKWELLPCWISFIRRSGLTPCNFRVGSPGNGTRFYSYLKIA